MISLFITLFICLFSVCPSYDSLEDHKENVIEEYDLQPKNLIFHPTTGNGDTNCYVAANSDILGTTFISNLYLRYGQYLGTNEYSYDNSFNCYVVPLNNLNLSKPMGDTGIQPNSFDYHCVSLSITCLRFSNDTYGKRYSRYEVNFNYDNNGSLTPFNSFQFDYFYPSVDSYGYYNEGILVTDHDIGISSKYFIWAVDNPNFLTTATYYFTNTDYELGYELGYLQGTENGERVGYQNGYNDGYTEGSSIDSTASTIFTGILDVALIPVNVFLTIFNFDVFGINIAGIVSALLTVSVVVIVFRFILGGKKDD